MGGHYDQTLRAGTSVFPPKVIGSVVSAFVRVLRRSGCRAQLLGNLSSSKVDFTLVMLEEGEQRPGWVREAAWGCLLWQPCSLCLRQFLQALVILLRLLLHLREPTDEQRGHDYQVNQSWYQQEGPTGCLIAKCSDAQLRWYSIVRIDHRTG